MRQPLDEILTSLHRIEALLERIEKIASHIAPPLIVPEWTPEEKEAWEKLVRRFNPR